MCVCWNVRSSPRRAIFCTLKVEISSPMKTMEPASTGWVPTMELNSVVFPEPLGPMRPVMPPSGTVRLTSRLATTPPKDFETPRTSMSVAHDAASRAAPRACSSCLAGASSRSTMTPNFSGHFSAAQPRMPC